MTEEIEKTEDPRKNISEILKNQEIVFVGVPRFRDKDGNPSCQNHGGISDYGCPFFTDSHDPVFLCACTYLDVGIDINFCKPHKDCPLWKDDK